MIESSAFSADFRGDPDIEGPFLGSGKRLVIMKYSLNDLNGAQRALVVQDKLTKSFSATIWRLERDSGSAWDDALSWSEYSALGSFA